MQDERVLERVASTGAELVAVSAGDQPAQVLKVPHRGSRAPVPPASRARVLTAPIPGGAPVDPTPDPGARGGD